MAKTLVAIFNALILVAICNFGRSGISIGEGGLSIGLTSGTHKVTSFHSFP